MADTQQPRNHLEDVNYLRGLSTKHLVALHKREMRSRDELIEYLQAITVVLTERGVDVTETR